MIETLLLSLCFVLIFVAIFLGMQMLGARINLTCEHGHPLKNSKKHSDCPYCYFHLPDK